MARACGFQRHLETPSPLYEAPRPDWKLHLEPELSHLLTASPSLEASGVEAQGFRAWRNLDVKGVILGGP